MNEIIISGGLNNEKIKLSLIQYNLSNFLKTFIGKNAYKWVEYSFDKIGKVLPNKNINNLLLL